MIAAMDRAEIVHQNFLRRVGERDFPARISSLGSDDLNVADIDLLAIFRAQIVSRHLDRVSRKLQARAEAFYTIGSSGHEGSAAVASVLRADDPAFLHYRDAAFQIQRAGQVPGETPIWDVLLSFTSSAEDPISGGRHKVLGSKSLNIPPQTSTIASHLPKAVGAAYSIGLNRRLKSEHEAYADGAIVLCSFGDASLNHSTAQGAINTAGWTAYQNVPMPILFLCEDNGIGISTKTPKGWIQASVSQRPGIRYFACNGLDMLDVIAVAREACDWVRTRRKPAFLHMQTVRLYGHAGADAQQAYLSKSEIEEDEANDPLLHSARIVIDSGAADKDGIIALYSSIDEQISRVAERAIQRPKLRSSKDVQASLIPPVRRWAPSNGPSASERDRIFGASDLRSMETPQHMAKLINLTLTDLMLAHREIVLAGEDIAAKGGVYGVTQRLHERFGPARVINTLLDEQSILGLAIGMAHNGLVPIPEIQFLAYLHNAEDQIRGEAATLSFFSNGQFTNPMVIRIAGLAYQRGFGGHFHNDNSIAVLRDIPGLVVACPSNGLDAVRMLRECVRLARDEQRVVVFLEPIALYMTRDLHAEKDGEWSFVYPKTGQSDATELGMVNTYGSGNDLVIVTYGNGYYFSRQAEKILRESHKMGVRVVDIRWLSPLPQESLIAAVRDFQKILIVDECRTTGSLSEALVALFVERLGERPSISRIAADDCFIATGPAFGATLPSRDAIVAAAIKSVCG